MPGGEDLPERPGVVRAARPPLEQRPIPGFRMRLSAAHRGQLQFPRPTGPQHDHTSVADLPDQQAGRGLADHGGIGVGEGERVRQLREHAGSRRALPQPRLCLALPRVQAGVFEG